MMKKKLQTKFSPRQYMLSRDFEIYYYNEHYRSNIKSHVHDYYEFYFFLEGHVSQEIDGKIQPLTSGDLVIIPPGLSHHVIIHDKTLPYRRFVLWVSSDYYRRLMTISADYGYILEYVKETGCCIFHNEPLEFNTLQTKIFRLIEESHSSRFGHEAMAALCINDVLLYLNRQIYERTQQKKQLESHNLYDRLLDHINEHLEDELTLEHLAKTFFVNKYHIAHLFKDSMGISLHQYVLKKRLAACRDAMNGPMKISEIYHPMGFKDYSGFYRAFKKEYGLSPREYQESLSVKIHSREI